MNRKALYSRLTRGAANNVKITDIVDLAEGFGFTLRRISGSHHILEHPAIPEIVNLQQHGRDAKAYQIRQFLRLIEAYNLKLKE